MCMIGVHLLANLPFRARLGAAPLKLVIIAAVAMFRAFIGAAPLKHSKKRLGRP